MRTLALLVLVVTLSLGCSNTGGGAAPAVGASEGERFRGSEARLVVRRASIEMTVDSPAEAASAIEAWTAESGGHVSNSTLYASSSSLSVRVPSEQLDAFLDRIASLGDETHRSVTGKDVTDSYADLEAEIGNLTSLRDRLRQLLDRAKNVEEVLDVERELTRVQTKLDSLTARKQRMETDLQLSVVQVTLAEREPKRILGPLGLLYEGIRWGVVKLFVISP